jgi:hypothetical protein
MSPLPATVVVGPLIAPPLGQGGGGMLSLIYPLEVPRMTGLPLTLAVIVVNSFGNADTATPLATTLKGRIFPVTGFAEAMPLTASSMSTLRPRQIPVRLMATYFPAQVQTRGSRTGSCALHIGQDGARIERQPTPSSDTTPLSAEPDGVSPSGVASYSVPE